MTRAEQESYDWFKKLIKSTAGAKAGDTYSKGNRKSLNKGNMLFFTYANPITPLKQLKAFDKYPLIVLLNKKGNKFLGVNLHWIPRPMRETFLKMVVKLNTQRIKKDKRIEITYGEIKEFLTRTGIIHVALKQYLINRITGLQYIKYTDWKHQIYLPTEKFVTDSSMSKADVENMIRGAIAQTRKSKNVRVGRKVQGKNKSRFKR